MRCPECFSEKKRSVVCPECDFDESQGAGSGMLPYRAALHDGRYVIGCLLGKPGGFGVAYKAWDNRFGAAVVIKECLLTASGQVWRDEGDVSVQVNEGFQDEYRRWLGRFLDEADRILMFGSRYIVRVVEVFEENNTAYYVMPFVEGETLAAYCASHGGRLPDGDVRQFALQLLSALDEMHAKKVFHRDIKPTNVLITKNKRKPVLIDFGAARVNFDDDRSRSHMAVHSPKYAPYEQVVQQRNQGPWTDIYALCATLHFCLVGEPPPRALKRYEPDTDDPYLPLVQRLPDVDPKLAKLIDEGLAVLPRNRLRTAKEAIDLLQGVDSTVIPEDEAAKGEGAATDHDTPSRTEAVRLPPDVGRPAEAFPWLSLIALSPALVILLVALAQGGGFVEYLVGWMGVLVVVNAVCWTVWYVNRPKPADLPPAVQPALQPALQPASTSSTLEPSQVDSVTGTVPGIEISLHADGVPVVIRTLKPLETLTIGRTRRADLAFPNETLSSRHVTLTVGENGDFSLTDLQSTNHTYRREPRSGNQPASWTEVVSASGQKGRFMLGPHDGAGVLLEIRQSRVPP